MLGRLALLHAILFVWPTKTSTREVCPRVPNEKDSSKSKLEHWVFIAQNQNWWVKVLAAIGLLGLLGAMFAAIKTSTKHRILSCYCVLGLKPKELALKLKLGGDAS